MLQDLHWIPEVYSGFLWLALNRLNGSISIRHCFSIDARVFESDEGRAELEQTLRWAEIRAYALLDALKRPQFRHLSTQSGTSILIDHTAVDAAATTPFTGNFFDPEMLACWLGWPPREA